jgi:hypothetical protein
MADIFPINKMISKLKVAPLQPAYFRVTITAPHLTGLIASDSISMYCQRAQLPGIQFQASSVRQSGVGNIERRPTDTDFQDFQGVFICDGEGEIIKFFHRWMQSIYKFDSVNGLNQQTNRGLKTYTFEYPENYESIIEITQYQVGNDSDISTTGAGSNLRTSAEVPVVTYTLNRAYPHQIGALATDWSTQNDYHLLPVNFHFQSWSSNYLDKGTSYDVPGTYNAPDLDIYNSVVESVVKSIGETTPGQLVKAGVDGLYNSMGISAREPRDPRRG